MKILAIGNSFSQDATRYLHDVAKADNEEMKVVNLYIGGCPLSEHYANILEDRKKYLLEFNGQNTGFYVSIKEALQSESYDGWDAVTIQQVSHKSCDYSTYTPYLPEIVRFIRKYSPCSMVYIHQTWAYEENSDRLTKELGYRHYSDMLNDIKKANFNAMRDVEADGIIPSGEVFDALLKNGISKVHRDTFHASLGAGRYALALTWYAVLTGKKIDDIEFSDFDEPVKKEYIKIIKKSVNEVLSKYK